MNEDAELQMQWGHGCPLTNSNSHPIRVERAAKIEMYIWALNFLVYFRWFSARGKRTESYFNMCSLLIFYVCACIEVANTPDRWDLVALH